jgi:hypothetical protein
MSVAKSKLSETNFMKKHIVTFLGLCIGIGILLGSSALADQTPGVASMKRRLTGVSTLELPERAAAIVTAAAPGDKERVAKTVLEAAIALKPAAASAIVAAIVKAHPSLASVVVVRAAQLQPDQAALIVRAAIAAAPHQADRINAAVAQMPSPSDSQLGKGNRMANGVSAGDIPGSGNGTGAAGGQVGGHYQRP